MKLFIDIVMKRIYLFNIVAWNYREKIGFPVCKKGKFRRPSSAPEARKERSCQSYSASHIKWRAERSFHRPTFIRPERKGKVGAASRESREGSRASIPSKASFPNSFRNATPSMIVKTGAPNDYFL